MSEYYVNKATNFEHLFKSVYESERKLINQKNEDERLRRDRLFVMAKQLSLHSYSTYVQG